MGRLFDAARANDPEAVEELRRIVGGFARRVCHGGGPAGAPEADWEDVAQEACRRLHAFGLAQYRGTGSERSFLYSTVKATVIQMARTANRRRRRELVVAPRETSASSDPNAGLDVGRILATLDESCRSLIERMFLRDDTYSEVAVDLGLAESSVRAKLSRCLKRARQIANEGGRS